MMNTTVQCQICLKHLKSISNTHLKTHNITEAEYKNQFPNSPIRAEYSLHLRTKNIKGKTYEEIYGITKAEELKVQRKYSAKKQMSDPMQIRIRREKCGAPEHYTLERKLNMRNAITDDVLKKRRNTMLINLSSGKYDSKKLHGRQSVQALKYIDWYIELNNIQSDYCYYHGGGISGSEYFQVIYDPITKKKKICYYDLVITEDQKHNIHSIIEIHGPWHYTLDEVLQDPHSKASPLKSNKYSKLQAYNNDCLKLNHALDLCEYVYVYWLRNKNLVRIQEKTKLLEI